MAWFFAALAVMSALAATGSFLSGPDSVERIFGEASNRVVLAGEVSLYTPPRGMPSLFVVTAEGRTAYVSCIAAPELCTRLAGSSTRLESTVVRLSPTTVWPIMITLPSYATMDEALSRARYLEYAEYEGTVWHLWAGLAALWLVFGYWFRRRPLFPVDRKPI